MSALPHIHRHFFGLQSASLGELHRVVVLCLGHTALPLKRMERLRDLAFSGESFKCTFPILQSRFLLKEI